MKFALCAVLALLALLPVSAQPPEAKSPTLRWFGQSFFQLETARGRKIVFDPHAIEAFGRPEVAADYVLITHPHNDHNQPEVLSNKGYKVYQGVKSIGTSGTRTEWVQVNEKIDDDRIHIRTIGLYHDAVGGMQRGKNSAWIVEVDGLTIAHLGDLGHSLNAEQVKAFGKIDVLILPVGGIYTINGEQARTVVEQLKPRLYVVPMHYGVPNFDDLLGPGEFLEGFPNVKKLKTNEFTITDTKPDAPSVILMDWKKDAAPGPKK